VVVKELTVKELLEAGAHFGHQTKRWCPRMKPYIFGAREGIHIIDLEQTARRVAEACQEVERRVAAGEYVLFVGTKRQAQEVIREEAERCHMFYANQRWLGGTLTNFQTIRRSVERLKALESMREDGTFEKLTKKEVLRLEREIVKLERRLGGIKEMDRLPGVVYIVDPHRERNAAAEARRMRILSIGLVDTNTDPEVVDLAIPANDDSIKTIQLITRRIADAVLEGLRLWEERLQSQPEEGEEAQSA